jgi:hypothetical protein
MLLPNGVEMGGARVLGMHPMPATAMSTSALRPIMHSVVARSDETKQRLTCSQVRCAFFAVSNDLRHV